MLAQQLRAQSNDLKGMKLVLKIRYVVNHVTILKEIENIHALNCYDLRVVKK